MYNYSDEEEGSHKTAVSMMKATYRDHGELLLLLIISYYDVKHVKAFVFKTSFQFPTCTRLLKQRLFIRPETKLACKSSAVLVPQHWDAVLRGIRGKTAC